MSWPDWLGPAVEITDPLALAVVVAWAVAGGAWALWLLWAWRGR